MMPFGHIVSALGAIRLGGHIFPGLNKLDWRLIALAPLVPDMIDKPLAMFVSILTSTPVTTRLVAYTLLPSMVLLAIGLFFRLSWLPYALAFSSHLVMDQMWETPAILFWPVYDLTPFFTQESLHIPEGVGHIQEQSSMGHTFIFLIEFGALAVLTWLMQRHQLWRWQNLKSLLLTGHIKIIAI